MQNNTEISVKYIIARYNEDITWLNELKKEDVIIYNKGTPLNIDNEILLKNVGKEPHTYLKYIIDNYNNLPDICVFSQGKVEDHIYGRAKDSISLLKLFRDQAVKNEISDFTTFINYDKNWTDDWNMRYPPTDIHQKADIYVDGIIVPFIDWFHKNIEPDITNLSKFYPNCLFAVSKKLILKRSKAYYENLLKQLDWKINTIVDAFMERSWYYIFCM